MTAKPLEQTGMSQECAIILVHYQNHMDTLACLQSALKLEYPVKTLVLVDNDCDSASHTALLALVKKYLTPVDSIIHGVAAYKSDDGTLVYVKKNTLNGGFSYGINRGIEIANKIANPSVYLAVNNDVVLPSNAVSAMVNQLDLTAGVGLVGVCSKVKHGKDTAEYAFGCVDGATGQTRQCSKQDIALLTSTKQSSRIVCYPLGSCLLIARSLYEVVGRFDESYFLYYEEPDYVMRMRLLSYYFSVCTSVVIDHKEGGAAGSSSKKSKGSSVFADYHLLRSRMLFLSRYFARYRFLWWMVHLGNCAKRLLRGELQKSRKAFSLLWVRYDR